MCDNFIPPCIRLWFHHPIHIAFFKFFFQFMVLLFVACRSILFPSSAPINPPIITLSPLPKLGPAHPAEQPGRAPTWCTTTCWPTWTVPAWTRRAAAAACRGRSCPLTCRRTRTMTPSGRATVTGWARCRVRAASHTRTKERNSTATLHCHVTYGALTSLPSMYLKESSFFFNLFIFYDIFVLLLLTYLIYLFSDGLFFFCFLLRCLKHLPVALPLSLLCASSLCVGVMQ